MEIYGIQTNRVACVWFKVQGYGGRLDIKMCSFSCTF
jgi:hypothetical protein